MKKNDLRMASEKLNALTATQCLPIIASAILNAVEGIFVDNVELI